MAVSSPVTGTSPGAGRPPTARRALQLQPGRTAYLAPTALRQDAVDVLMHQQLGVRELLARYDELSGSAGFRGHGKRALADQLCAELAVHLHVVNEVLLPWLLAEAERQAVVLRAAAETEVLRYLVHQTMDTDVDDPLMDARIQVLSEVFDIYIHGCLCELMPLTRRSGADMLVLGQALQKRAAQLMDEVGERGGVNFEDESADPVGLPPR